ncbi:MAG: YjbQ family protein, partial [Candidatus Cloacimonetes bacterium]|nr:YjbQ family protein [Candidatus Cloacimonadota bacterium]
MKSYRKEIWMFVDKRRGFVNITSEVENCVQESGIQEGLCLVNP